MFVRDAQDHILQSDVLQVHSSGVTFVFEWEIMKQEICFYRPKYEADAREANERDKPVSGINLIYQELLGYGMQSLKRFRHLKRWSQQEFTMMRNILQLKSMVMTTPNL